MTHTESNTDKIFFYEKAFDSAPHSLALELLSIYKINPIIKIFLRITMQNLQTSISLRIGQSNIETNPIKHNVRYSRESLPVLYDFV